MISQIVMRLIDDVKNGSGKKKWFEDPVRRHCRLPATGGMQFSPRVVHAEECNSSVAVGVLLLAFLTLMFNKDDVVVDGYGSVCLFEMYYSMGEGS